MTASVRFAIVSRLEPSDVADLTDLLDEITDHDGLRPLSEHVWLHAKEGGEEHGLHVIARDAVSDSLVGYAHIDVTDEVEGASAEFTVAPSHRRRGIGTALIERLVSLAPDGRLRLWAHGEQAGASELAELLGFRRSRVLWQMRRSLYAPLPRAVVPAGIEIHPFVPGKDEEAWLRVNARAFPHLPDQGSWSRADLDRRLREPWFSPAGFLLAWRGAELVGFHWTKVHGSSNVRGHHHAAIGEVYVVGVDPQERGSGLGRALTLTGLHHLRSLGLDQAMLYVDASNIPAISLYEGLGFARWDTDVLFQR